MGHNHKEDKKTTNMAAAAESTSDYSDLISTRSGMIPPVAAGPVRVFVVSLQTNRSTEGMLFSLYLDVKRW